MAHTTPLAGARLHRAGRSGPAFSLLFRVFSVFRERQALARLTDAQLSDVGLTRAQALAEAKRPLWDVPATWRN